MNDNYRDIDGVLIYSRVSTPKQVLEGHGLDSQETLCRQFVARLGLTDKIEAVFAEGMTGKLFDRSEMQALLRHIDQHKNRKYLVVFDDLKRFAREVETHLRLKKEFGKRKAVLASPNFNFEESPTGRFVENVMASAAQLEREQNAEQTKDKMKARLLNGCWALKLPSEYRYQRDPRHGKIATIVPELAAPMKRLFEAVDQRQVVGWESAREFLQRLYDEAGINKRAAIETIRGKLTNPLYAGLVEYPKWGVKRRPGVHQAIISPEIFDRVQDILAQRTVKPSRKDYRPDFPLRGRMLCFVCHRPLTASWNKGRNRRYPNYHCYYTDCPVRGLVYPKEIVEPQFEDYLGRIRPGREIIALVATIFEQIWRDEQRGSGVIMTELKGRIEASDKRVKGHLESASRAPSPVLKGEYEQLAQSAIEERKRLEDELSRLQAMQTDKGLGTAAQKVFAHFSEPVRLWRSGDGDDQKAVLDMYFETPPIYDPEYGFGTTKLTCLPAILQVSPCDENQIVRSVQDSWKQLASFVTDWDCRLRGKYNLYKHET